MAALPDHCRSRGRRPKTQQRYAFQLRTACAFLRSTHAGSIESVTLSLPVASTTMEALLATVDLDGLRATVVSSASHCSVRLRRSNRPDAQPRKVS